MSLRSKFTIVLTLLGLTLVINVVLSVWSIRFLERELAWPLRSAQPVLSGFHEIKLFGEQEAKLLENAQHDADRGALGLELIALEDEIAAVLKELDALPTVLIRSGATTTRNLADRSGVIVGLMNRWVDDGSFDAFEDLTGQVEFRHELIERVEARFLQDAGLAAHYGEKLAFVILSIIGVSVGGAIVSGLYAAILLRRWIIEPVGLLRVGAQKLGRGEFDHRIELQAGDELGQLGDEFNRMASLIKAMQDERVERERLAAMGEMAQRTVHNLRTPLAGIRALAETTKSELEEGSELGEMQDRIMASVDRFEIWLQGMLRVSSPMALDLALFQPAKLVEDVIGSLNDAASGRSILFEMIDKGLPESATGDSYHLDQALTAILSNAIDFAPADTVIEVRCSHEDRYWTVCVIDHGPGIESGLHAAIFRPYFTTRKSGTGIGLAMVKRIIEQHHGIVGVESPIDPVSASGTMFMIKVPVDAKTRP